MSEHLNSIPGVYMPRRNNGCPHCGGTHLVREPVLGPIPWLNCAECAFRFPPDSTGILITQGPDGRTLRLPVQSRRNSSSVGGPIKEELSGTLPIESESVLRDLCAALADATAKNQGRSDEPLSLPTPPTGTEKGEGGLPKQKAVRPAHDPKRPSQDRQPARSPPGWADLGDAKRTILTVLNGARERLQGQGIATKAGYKYGSLRHHFGKLQTWKAFV
jgi:hypothetical protein